MHDLKTIDKNKKDIDNILNHFIKDEFLQSKKMSVIECSLFTKFYPPKILLQYELKEHEFIDLNFYKEHQLNDYWNLDLNIKILSILKNIPDLLKVSTILSDIHYIHSSLTSLNTKIKINTYGDLEKIKKSIDNCCSLNDLCISGKFSIDANSLNIVKLEFESDLLNFIIKQRMDSEDFIFFNYKIIYDINMDNFILEFTKKRFKSFNSNINRPPKLLTENKETYESKNNTNFLMDFKKNFIAKMMNETLQILNISIDDIKLRDLDFITMLDY